MLSTESHKICSKCNEIISGEAPKIQVDQNTFFHSAHFTCAECGVEIGANPYKKVENLYYCNNDYFSLFAPICGHCRSIIKTYGISISNVSYHLEHFLCYKCNQPIIPSEGSKDEKNIKDFLNRTCMLWKNQVFHKTCFTCEICNNLISNIKDLSKESDIGPIHAKCTEKLLKCAKCNKPCGEDYYKIKEKVFLFHVIFSNIMRIAYCAQNAIKL